jgi:hypothetical protein
MEAVMLTLPFGSKNNELDQPDENQNLDFMPDRQMLREALRNLNTPMHDKSYVI